MAITDSQKVDLLYKKIGFGVAKTDTSAFKSPSNEANTSPILTRGDTIWQASDQIPTTIPLANTSVVILYSDSLSSTVETTLDTTVSGTNRTWLTNIRDWIPPEFGSDYQVKVYADSAGSTTPQTTGTRLFADGSGNSDSWYFDYQAGILNFPDTNVPSAVAGKKVFISGARYVGAKGISGFANISSNTASFGNLTTGNVTITGGNITNITRFTTSNATITGGNITANMSGNITGIFGTFTGNLNSNWIVANSAQISSNLFVANSSISAGNINLDDIKIVGNTISSRTTDIVITANSSNPNNIIRLESVSAFEIPNGTTVQRPPNPESGYLRYNTDYNTIEWWSSNTWIQGTQIITAETITPDGTNNTFTLSQSTTTDSILVNINGTIQQSSTGAYSVTGNQITFSEIPLTTDIIEIRYIARSLAGTPGGAGNLQAVSSNILPAANITYSIGSVSKQWDALWVNGNVNLNSNLNLALTTGTPSNTATPASWLRVYVGGTRYYLPLYQ